MVSCKPTVSCTMMGLYQWSYEFNPNPRRVTIAGSPATPQRDLNLRDCTQVSGVTDAYKTGWVRKPSSTNWSRLVSSAETARLHLTIPTKKKRTASFLLVIPLPSFSATFQHLPMSSLSSPTLGYTWVLSASIHPNLITINHTWLYIYIHIYIYRIPSNITFRVKSLSVPTVRLPPWHFHHLAQLLHQLLPSLGAGRLL